jgi:hypothetical protein
MGPGAEAGTTLMFDRDAYANTIVMPGLDPRIHPSSKAILRKDGSPGQAR